MPDIRVHFKGNYEELLNAVDDIVNKNKEGYVGVFMQISSWPSNGFVSFFLHNSVLQVIYNYLNVALNKFFLFLFY